MHVVGKGPVHRQSLMWRRSSGQPVLTVVAKDDYRRSPATCRLSRTRRAVATQNQFVGGDPRKSWRSASDLAPHKSRADVVLVGSAYAQGGATSVMVRFAVGSFEKSLGGLRRAHDHARTGSLTNRAPKLRVRHSPTSARPAAPDTGNHGRRASDMTDGLGRRFLPRMHHRGYSCRWDSRESHRRRGAAVASLAAATDLVGPSAASLGCSLTRRASSIGWRRALQHRACRPANRRDSPARSAYCSRT